MADITVEEVERFFAEARGPAPTIEHVHGERTIVLTWSLDDWSVTFKMSTRRGDDASLVADLAYTHWCAAQMLRRARESREGPTNGRSDRWTN